MTPGPPALALVRTFTPASLWLNMIPPPAAGPPLALVRTLTPASLWLSRTPFPLTGPPLTLVRTFTPASECWKMTPGPPALALVRTFTPASLWLNMIPPPATGPPLALVRTLTPVSNSRPAASNNSAALVSALTSLLETLDLHIGMSFRASGTSGGCELMNASCGIAASKSSGSDPELSGSANPERSDRRKPWSEAVYALRGGTGNCGARPRTARA